jgi:5-methylcytosine-specific restriction endonuclease McrA
MAVNRKKKIPKALREAVWIKYAGTNVMSKKCATHWCPNIITAFDFQTGHNIPESKGGPTTIDNLVPLCSRCNQSMGNQYTIDQWNTKFGTKKRSFFSRMFGCFTSKETNVAPVPSVPSSKKPNRS